MFGGNNSSLRSLILPWVEKRGLADRFRASTHKSVNTVCKKLDISILYNDTVGIKCLNQIINSDLFDLYAGDTYSHTLDPSDPLMFGFDGLVDRYTLINTQICHSPHYKLMEVLAQGKPIEDTEYFNRCRNGTLDFRPARNVDQRLLENALRSFEKAHQDITAGTSQPIKAQRVNGTLYICDGKHRAAMCAVLGVNVVITEISPFTDSFFWWVHRKMLRQRHLFVRHIDYFDEILSCTLEPGKS